jgi:hypothetical protein
MWARRELVKQYMSSLYEVTLSSMLSEHHVPDHLRLLASTQYFDWRQPSYTAAQAELQQKLQYSEARFEAARSKAMLVGTTVRAMKLGSQMTQAISHQTAKAILSATTPRC